MKTHFLVLFLAVILNPSVIFSEHVKDVEVNFNISKSNNENQISRWYKLSSSIMKGTPKTSGKWQVGRVSRKQYEIINMLWKKTKIFVERESSTTMKKTLKSTEKYKRTKHGNHLTLVDHNPIQESFQLVRPKSRFYSSTPSYIEFYYLDTFDERIKHRDLSIKNRKNVTPKPRRLSDKIIKAGLLRSPFFLFRVNEATCKATTNIVSHHFAKFSPVTDLTRNNNLKHSKSFITLAISRRRDKVRIKHNSTRSTSMKKKNYPNTVSLTDKKYKRKMIDEEFDNISKDFFDTMKIYTSPKKTTANDRIRFFDIYDSYINTPYIMLEEDEDRMINSNTIQNKEKIDLYQVDHNVKHDDTNKTRYVKKHAIHNKDSFKIDLEFHNSATVINTIPGPTEFTAKQSRLPTWSEYSFVAVYVYEPTQVRCDSASISPHWLVASATCLNRHHKDIKHEGRSAFVAYCSGNWRHPGRIAYVKQSLLHPRFHPKDNSRRQLYNIGAIQVVNSMADTCSGWAPVTFISHHFVASSGGTPATAIGWGLDRYDPRHSQTAIPKHLMLYEGLVYSDSCPGNTGYSKTRRLDEGSVTNVYCLSLPPYSKENDAVHGSLLLIGGKLIALYMKEDRRTSGNQSAQYTGIWRLIPWLLEVAKEPYELDRLNLEI